MFCTGETALVCTVVTAMLIGLTKQYLNVKEKGPTNPYLLIPYMIQYKTFCDNLSNPNLTKSTIEYSKF